MLNIVNNTEFETLYALISKLKTLYKDKNFISVINIFNEIKRNKAFQESYHVNLNILYQLYSYAFAANIMLLNYKKALEEISEFYSYYIEICSFYTFVLKTREQEKKKKEKTENKTKELITHLQSEFKEFNKGKYIEFYVNLAFANYKNKNYIDAIYYFDIAINKIEKFHKNEESLIELYVGKTQSLYYYYNKKLKENDIKDCVQEYIDKISKYGDSIDVLFALAKLNYFIREPQYALNYIELALDKIGQEQNSPYKIHAYDWLSRITYSSKQYATANKFYKQLISLLIEDKENVENINLNNKIIYPKPILADMVKYLNETNNLVAKEEASYVYQSIYIGILAAAIMETAEIYSGNSDKWNIIIFMWFILIIMFIVNIIRNYIKGKEIKNL